MGLSRRLLDGSLKRRADKRNNGVRLTLFREYFTARKDFYYGAKSVFLIDIVVFLEVSKKI